MQNYVQMLSFKICPSFVFYAFLMVWFQSVLCQLSQVCVAKGEITSMFLLDKP